MDLSKERLAELATKAIHDEQAFEELYNYFFPKVYYYILQRVNNKAIAEDLVSNIFLKALRNLTSLKNSRDFQGWLFSIARNALIDHYRKAGRKKEEASEAVSDDKTILYETPEDQLLIKEHNNQIYQALDTLSPEQSEVVILRFMHELKLKEIAKVIDKSEGAVKGLLYRALKKLSIHFQDREVQK
ncbi:RNA polymerase sigma factor [Natranaerobius trueperi]|uniref:RNA polymerase sigma factor n=1 Tax=Natranaerobius trueperi TaxID=759412 RepID=UPI0013033103|nr:RNA polymerase sigma factor [Natranaerobius trueperi]